MNMKWYPSERDIYYPSRQEAMRAADVFVDGFAHKLSDKEWEIVAMYAEFKDDSSLQHEYPEEWEYLCDAHDIIRHNIYEAIYNWTHEMAFFVMDELYKMV